MSPTNEIVSVKDSINDVMTFDEAIAAGGIPLEDTIVVINPYTVLNKDKDALLNKPFFIRMVKFTVDTDTGAEYAVFYAVTRDNEMFVVTDGSTGIHKQLISLVERYQRDYSFLIANGLRKSDYKIESGENKGKPATTYYLA